jgi:hypothetical protein
MPANVSNNKMKPIQPKSLLFIILVLFASLLSAQKNQIGLDIGYGKTTIEDYQRPLVSPFNKDLSDYARIGIFYYYTPTKAFFSIKTGLTYDYKGQNSTNLNYLRVPLGLNFTIGHRIQCVFGCGFYSSFLIAYRRINDPNFEDSKNRFQLGVQGNLGVGFQVSSRLSLSIIFQNNFDLTNMYKDQRTAPSGGEYSLDEKGYDGFIQVSLRRTLIKD